MIEARQLTKEFRDRRRGTIRAVDGLSFRAEPGRVYGLLGANGAGKTTALRLLTTLLRPTAGTALVGGADVAAVPEQVRAMIGFLGAGGAPHGRLTGRELLTYFGRLHGLEAPLLTERIGLLAEQLELHSFLDRRCGVLSTGMRQRISIAQVLVHDPAVMILDEPTLGLDVMTARAVVRFVRDCRERGKTVLYSTHIMAEAEKLCDTIGIIHRGRLLAEGTLDALRERFGESDLEEIFVKAVGGEGNGEG